MTPPTRELTETEQETVRDRMLRVFRAALAAEFSIRELEFLALQAQHTTGCRHCAQALAVLFDHASHDALDQRRAH
jgi:hypothetical protein